MEEIAWACAGVNTTLAANMLASMPLIIAGTDAQKQKYLGRLTAGEGGKPVYACYACSEPDAGSDVAGMRTRVEKKGDEYILNGQKRWITNGGVASFCTTFATLDPKLRHKGITRVRRRHELARREDRQEGKQDGPALVADQRRHLRRRARAEGEPPRRRGRAASRWR